MLGFLTNDGDLIPLEVFTLFIYPSFSHRFKSWIWFIRDEAGEEENLKVLSRCLLGNPVKTVPKDQCMLVHECNMAFTPSRNSFKECNLQILHSNLFTKCLRSNIESFSFSMNYVFNRNNNPIHAFISKQRILRPRCYIYWNN